MPYDFSQGYGNVQGADPLGSAVQGRGLQRRFQFQQQHPGSSFGPLPSAAWEGLFQAMQENGVDKVADNSVGEARGMFGQGGGNHFSALPSTYNPQFQHSAAQGGPLQGLQGAMPPGYQSHEQFMQNNPAAQAHQQRRQPVKPPTSGGY